MKRVLFILLFPYYIYAHNKFKIFVGAWGLLSYDYINWTNKKHHFGAFGVLPITYEGGDFNID